MLSAIEQDTLFWTCLHYDRGGRLLSCGKQQHAQLSETAFVHVDVERPRRGRLAGLLARVARVPEADIPMSGRGAVMALPRCQCGVQMFLKADYSIEEVWACCIPLVNSEGRVWAYGLRYGHLHNLLAHALHYERGNTPFAPCLPMPPEEMLRGELPPDVLRALWFGWLAYREYGCKQKGIPALAPLAEILALPEPVKQAVDVI